MTGDPAILFAHAAYRLGDAYAQRRPGAPYREARNADELRSALPDAEILVVSGLWRDEWAAQAPRLRFIQSVSAGTDQFGRDVLRERGIRLASAQGGNERAVAEHAMALLLALTRRIPEAVANQGRHAWRPMIADRAVREDELSGKTALVVGFGRIGARLGRLLRAFDVRVVGVRRSPARDGEPADAIVPPERLLSVLPEADIVVLTCPLTPETERLIRAEHFRAMKPTALLVNVARGRVVDEEALVDALRAGEIAGAGLDCTAVEPLPPDSPLWSLPNVLITPHSAGETRRYEDAVVDILLDNLGRLERGEALRNAVV